MNPPPPLITKAKLDAFVALAFDWLGWLLVIVLKLGAPTRSRTLRRLVEGLERHVERVIFLMAIHRLKRRRRSPTPRRPLSIAPGFRRIAAAARRRLLFKHAGVCDRRLSLHARVLRLISALANPERYIARFARRCRRGLCFSWIAVCAPPALTLSADAPCEFAFADST